MVNASVSGGSRIPDKTEQVEKRQQAGAMQRFGSQAQGAAVPRRSWTRASALVFAGLPSVAAAGQPAAALCDYGQVSPTVGLGFCVLATAPALGMWLRSRYAKSHAATVFDHEDVREEVREEVRERSTTKRLFFLASCPDSLLPEAIQLTREHGGYYTAGDKIDTLHSKMLPDSGCLWPLIAKVLGRWNPAWKSAWIGKTKQRLDDFKADYPGQEVIAIAICGGRGCNWERAQLYPPAPFPEEYPNLTTKQCGDLEEYRRWLKENVSSFAAL